MLQGVVLPNRIDYIPHIRPISFHVNAAIIAQVRNEDNLISLWLCPLDVHGTGLTKSAIAGKMCRRLEGENNVSKRSSDRGKGTIVLFVLAFLLGVAYVAWIMSQDLGAEPSPTNTPVPSPAVAGPEPTRTLRPTRTPEPADTSTPVPPPSATPLPRRYKVAIVAGHWQHDPGAVCPDGLQEVHINLDVASRTVALLQHEGHAAELLPEFSEKLDGYKADAFLSIHADSCESFGASGFKVVRVASSAIPEEEDRLVTCLTNEYGSATGLLFHPDTITFDMTDYHAFKEIDSQTPGAIIELGFMDADRELLTNNTASGTPIPLAVQAQHKAMSMSLGISSVFLFQHFQRNCRNLTVVCNRCARATARSSEPQRTFLGNKYVKQIRLTIEIKPLRIAKL